MKIGIIGSGIGGLGTAALLAKEGHEVTIFEKNEKIGGRCNIIEEKGYKFDTGPSWYLMPDVFERFFAEFDKSSNDYFKLIRLDPHYRIILDSGDFYDITGDLERDLKTFEEIEPGSSQRFIKYLEQSKEKYEISMDKLLYNNYDSIVDFVKDKNVRNSGRKLSVLETMDRYVGKFFNTEIMRQIVQYSLVFLGGSPRNTPALYSLMTHIDFNLGVWYPDGGMYELIKAVGAICLENGVEIIRNTPIDEIITNGNRVTGIKSGEQIYEFDIVISNADYHHTERLFDNHKLINYSDSYWDKKIQSPSAFLMFLGVKGSIPELVHHNIFFGENWIEHFNQIFDHPQWPEKPSIYISKTSHSDSTVAPEGYENVVILTPIPVGIEDTPEIRQKYGDFILNYLENHLALNLKDRIAYKRTYAINDFTNDYNSYKGSALGLAHNLTQSAIWRPENRSKSLENLFYVGANTTPGIGVPICLISASLVRDRVNEYVENQ